MIDARRTELLTIRIEHGARIDPGELISALQTIPDGWVIADISGFAVAEYQQIEIRIEPDERTS
nr:MAG TPA: Vacuolar sorting protein 39 domain 2 [Caudoviricetes sp.]